jgi:hypothetical protein
VTCQDGANSSTGVPDARSRGPLGDGRQRAGTVLMVRPCCFGPNPETAVSNRFQRPTALVGAQVARAAEREFDGLAAALDRMGVRVLVAEDSPSPRRPDAVFPNNWFSTHGDGTVILYPLASPLRRLERRPGLLRETFQKAGLATARFLDLAFLEARDEFLEGTGSLVLDRIQGIAYATPSPRTTDGALAAFAGATGYRIVTLESADGDGVPVYHTNVLLALGAGIAVYSPAALPSAGDRHALEEALVRTGRTLVPISLDQMAAFAGNLLELEGRDGHPVIALSAGAWSALGPAQRRALEAAGAPLPVAVPTIEAVGGGSVRCMLAEVFLPPLSPASN